MLSRVIYNCMLDVSYEEILIVSGNTSAKRHYMMNFIG